MSNQAAQELQAFVRRVESVEDEINVLNQDKSAIYKEAKDGGFNVKILRKVIAARRMDSTKREEQDAEFELYWNAVHGIEPDLVRAHVHVHAREADWEEAPRREFPDDSAVQVYFIAAPSLGLIKIGSTGMIDRRVAAIQRGTPVPTEFIGAIGGGTKREVELHQKFAAHRVHGEWFAEVIRPEIALLLSDKTNIEEFDAETGEITEPQPPASAAQMPATVAVQADAANGSVPTSLPGAEGIADQEPIQPETAIHEGEAQKVERRSPKPEDAGSIPATFAIAGSSNGRTAEFDSANAGSTPSPASNVTAIRPTKLYRPLCQNRELCGASGPKECWKCLKAAEQGSAA